MCFDTLRDNFSGGPHSAATVLFIVGVYQFNIISGLRYTKAVTASDQGREIADTNDNGTVSSTP